MGFDFIVSWITQKPRDASKPERYSTSQQLQDGSMKAPMLPGKVMHTMISGQISNQIVGRISDWIYPDAPEDESFAKYSAEMMSMELEYAAHLTCQACLLPYPPKGMHGTSPNFAQCITQYLSTPSASMALWLTVPLVDGSWDTWDSIRFQCHHHRNLGVALQLGNTLPERDDIRRWLGEPVKALIVSMNAFVYNSRGYPTLPEEHVDVIVMAYTQGIQVILDAEHRWETNPPPIPDEEDSLVVAGEDEMNQLNISGTMKSIRVHWEYLSYIFRKQPGLSEDDILEIPYRDFLQAPLQPLQDNLESQTYETFERDSPKYVAYEAAVCKALEDPSTSFSSGQVIIMVVGAGRGPLVAASLSAGVKSNRDVRIFAVEKNRNAVVHLHARAMAEGWGNKVTIVHADMRHWHPDFKAHILVSELLGSFGDNELSPECLDGAQKFLRKDGISIPSSYTSYLSPITATKAWTEVSVRDSLQQFETPFVVRLHAYREIAPPKRMFQFDHPNWDAVIHNDRCGTVHFINEQPYGVICHGFAGYFEATLYKDIMLSIHPATHTTDMHSWFPIFFPVRTPFHVPAGSDILASMWRISNSTKVWYEWGVTKPLNLPIHNPNGRSYHVGL